MTFIRLLPFSLLVVTVACNEDRVRQLEKQNQELAEKLDKVTKGASLELQKKCAASLELQKKCADQAAAVFKELGWNKGPMAFYSNHYQPTTNKCFIRIENTALVSNTSSTSINVSDAFEGKVYVHYFWMNREGKKYWEVKPFMCKVTLLSGEEKHCQSQEEFDELVKVYMEQ